MNEKVMFSVIIVTLNAENEIENTIKSIEAQICDDFEVIVKDGCSKDMTLNKIPQKEKYHIYSMKDKSVYDGMNQAIKLATGRFVIFLNAGDAFASKDTLLEISTYIQKNNIQDHQCVLYGNYYRKDSGIQNQPYELTDFYLYRRPLCHQSLLYSRNLFDIYGLYNANYKISADHEYTMKLWKAQVSFLHTKNTVCMYEGGGISESSTGWKTAVSERTRIRKQYYSKKSRVKYELILFFSFSKLRAWIDSEKSPQCINKIYVSIRNRTFSKK